MSLLLAVMLIAMTVWVTAGVVAFRQNSCKPLIIALIATPFVVAPLSAANKQRF
jgi:hypothetical protein